MNRIFLYFFLIAHNVMKSSQDGLVIDTTLGPVMGHHITSYEGRTVSAFEGIPYAKPPVGELRFKEPQPMDPWSETYTANTTYVCMQYTYILPRKGAKGVEDCLYLYVYVPKESINGDENLAVVVHVHGGAFLIGDPASLSAPDYIMDRDVIYVSMNYRLGLLGFLSTEDEVVPGNNGLKDQALAMRWVKDNIRNFGGNPDSITLTGVSAGATCVHFHYLSPLSEGLFHRGMSQSGTAINPWSLTKHPNENARKIAERLGCSTENSQEMIDCLRDLPGENVTTATSVLFAYRNVLPPNVFAPVIEPDLPGAFITEHPFKLLSEGKFQDVPWITSNTKDEGVAPVGFFPLFKKTNELTARWKEIFPYSLSYHETVGEGDKDMIAEKAKEYYLGNASISMDSMPEVIKMHSDRLFILDGEKAARLQAKNGKSPVYYYYFDYYIDILVLYKARMRAVAHADDVKLVYRASGNPKVLSERDRKMKDVMLDIWYNYTSTGVPNLENVEWQPVSPSDETFRFLHLSSTEEVYMDNATEMAENSFWNSLPFRENERLFT